MFARENYVSLWSRLEFLLPGSSAPEEHNRKEGLGELMERLVNLVPVVFKG